MPKSFLRIVAVILISCLITDPAIATVLGGEMSPRYPTLPLQLDLFTHQALIARIAGAIFPREGDNRHQAVHRLLEKYALSFHFPLSVDSPGSPPHNVILYTPEGGTFQRGDERFLGPLQQDVDDYVGAKKPRILERARRKDQRIVFCLPTYKSADRIGHRLETLAEHFEELKKAHPNWTIELIVGVNGSTPEEVASLARIYQSGYSRIGIHLLIMAISLAGQNHAMNTMSQFAREQEATVLGFLNDDVDYAVSGIFEEGVERLLSSGDLAVVGGAHAVSEDTTAWQRVGHIVRSRITNVIPNGALTILYADTYPGIPEYMASNELYLAAYFLKREAGHEMDRILMLERPAYVRRFPEFWSREFRRLMRKALAKIQIRQAFPKKARLLDQALERRHGYPLRLNNPSFSLKNQIVFLPPALLYYGTRRLAYACVWVAVKSIQLGRRSFPVSPWWPYAHAEQKITVVEPKTAPGLPFRRPLPSWIETYTTDEEDVGEPQELFETSIYPSYVQVHGSGTETRLTVQRHGLALVSVPERQHVTLEASDITRSSLVVLRASEPDGRTVLAVANINQGTSSRDRAWTEKIANEVVRKNAQLGRTHIQVVILYDPGIAAWTKRPEIASVNQATLLALRQRRFPSTKVVVTPEQVFFTYQDKNQHTIKEERIGWKIKAPTPVPSSRLKIRPVSSRPDLPGQFRRKQLAIQRERERKLLYPWQTERHRGVNDAKKGGTQRLSDTASFDRAGSPQTEWESTQDVRRVVWPLLRKIFRRRILPTLPDQGIFLDLGAGWKGEMGRLAEDLRKNPRIRWVESDFRLDRLQGPRSFSANKVIAVLPDLLQIRDGSIDVLFGLSLLDAIANRELPASFAAMARVLKAGGRVVQILDASPTWQIVGDEFIDRGWLPFIYTKGAHTVNHAARIAFLHREKIIQHMDPQSRRLGFLLRKDARSRLNLRIREAHPFTLWRQSPGESMVDVWRGEGSIMADYDLAEFMTSSLQAALAGTGLIVDFCGAMSEEGFVLRSTLPNLEENTTGVVGQYGSVTTLTEGPRDPLGLSIRYAPFVLLAHKPAEATADRADELSSYGGADLTPGESKSLHIHIFHSLLQLLDSHDQLKKRGITSRSILNSDPLLNVGLESVKEDKLRDENITTYLRARGIHATGLSPQTENREGFVRGVVQNMQAFRDNQFGAVICAGLFSPTYIHTKYPDETDRKEFYRNSASEIRRVLRDQGFFLLDTYRINPEWLTALKEAGFEIIPLPNYEGNDLTGSYLLINQKPTVVQPEPQEEMQKNTHPMAMILTVGLSALSFLGPLRWRQMGWVSLPFDQNGVLAFIYAAGISVLAAGVVFLALGFLYRWLHLPFSVRIIARTLEQKELPEETGPLISDYKASLRDPAFLATLDLVAERLGPPWTALFQVPRDGGLRRGLNRKQTWSVGTHSLLLMAQVKALAAKAGLSEEEQLEAVWLAAGHDGLEKIDGDMSPSDPRWLHKEEIENAAFITFMNDLRENPQLRSFWQTLLQNYKNQTSVAARFVKQLDKQAALVEFLIYATEFPEHQNAFLEIEAQPHLDQWAYSNRAIQNGGSEFPLLIEINRQLNNVRETLIAKAVAAATSDRSFPIDHSTLTASFLGVPNPLKVIRYLASRLRRGLKPRYAARQNKQARQSLEADIAALGVELKGARHLPLAYMEDVLRILKKIPDETRRKSVRRLAFRSRYLTIKHTYFGRVVGQAFMRERRARVNVLWSRTEFQLILAHEIGHLLLKNAPHVEGLLRDVSWRKVPWTDSRAIAPLVSAVVYATVFSGITALLLPARYRMGAFIVLYVLSVVRALWVSRFFRNGMRNSLGRRWVYDDETGEPITPYARTHPSEEAAELVASFIVFPELSAARSLVDEKWESKQRIISDGLFEGQDFSHEPLAERLRDDLMATAKRRIWTVVGSLQLMLMIWFCFPDSWAVARGILVMLLAGTSLIPINVLPPGLELFKSDPPRGVAQKAASMAKGAIGIVLRLFSPLLTALAIILVLLLRPVPNKIAEIHFGPEPSDSATRIFFRPPEKGAAAQALSSQEELVVPWTGMMWYATADGSGPENRLQFEKLSPVDYDPAWFDRARIMRAAQRLPTEFALDRFQELRIFFSQTDAGIIHVNFERSDAPGAIIGKAVRIEPGQPLRLSRDDFDMRSPLESPIDIISIVAHRAKPSEPRIPPIKITRMEIQLRSATARSETVRRLPFGSLRVAASLVTSAWAEELAHLFSAYGWRQGWTEVRRQWRGVLQGSVDIHRPGARRSHWVALSGPLMSLILALALLTVPNPFLSSLGTLAWVRTLVDIALVFVVSDHELGAPLRDLRAAA